MQRSPTRSVYAQRGWNGQPVLIDPGDGGLPGIVVSRGRGGTSTRGIAPSNPRL
jgi:hypothetical protein